MTFKEIETLQPLLNKIDELQSEINELKNRQPDAYLRIMESWAIESTYNSNNIEGSTLSLGETALLYDGAEVKGKHEDINQAKGGFAALRLLRQSVEGLKTLDEALIKSFHELIFAEACDQKTRGSYRTVEVEITGTPFLPTPASFISERMKALVESCQKSKKHPAIVAALFHLEFESIHPFINANGRTGRIISNYLLMTSGFEPVNIQAYSRADYIACLRAFQINDDPFPFASFFCSNLEERQEKVLSLLKEFDKADVANDEVSNDTRERSNRQEYQNDKCSSNKSSPSNRPNPSRSNISKYLEE